MSFVLLGSFFCIFLYLLLLLSYMYVQEAIVTVFFSWYSNNKTQNLIFIVPICQYEGSTPS